MPIDLLKSLVSIKSYSREEQDIAAFLANWLEQRGLEPEVRDHNVIVQVTGDSDGPTMLLNTHLDTVPAKDGWETDPWTPQETNGRLYGLGAGDAKASLAAMATATVKLAAAGLPAGRLIFAATVMEEVGHGGLEHVAPTLGEIDGAFVGEPTNLQPALAQGGLLILEGIARGRTAHAARSHLGVNAITIAARDAIAVADLSLDREHPLLGPSSINLTQIQGGTRHNVIPDRCDTVIDIRYTPSYSDQEITELVRAACDSEIVVRSNRLKPVETAEDAAITRALFAEYPESKPFGSPTMSDWVHLRGIDAIKLGPGDSEESHTPNESVSLKEVVTGAELYERVARRFLAGM